MWEVTWPRPGPRVAVQLRPNLALERVQCSLLCTSGAPDSQAGGGGHSSAGVHPVCSLVPTSAFAVLIDGLELVLTPLVLFALTVSN